MWQQSGRDEEMGIDIADSRPGQPPPLNEVRDFDW